MSKSYLKREGPNNNHSLVNIGLTTLRLGHFFRLLTVRHSHDEFTMLPCHWYLKQLRQTTSVITAEQPSSTEAMASSLLLFLPFIFGLHLAQTAMVPCIVHNANILYDITNFALHVQFEDISSDLLKLDEFDASVIVQEEKMANLRLVETETCTSPFILLSCNMKL